MANDTEKLKRDILVEVFRRSNKDIARGATRQCLEHRWRKVDDTNLECLICPTAIIVNNADDYVQTESPSPQ